MMKNPFSLENKTILVTGASSGIGKVTAIEISKLGGRLIITGRDEERLEETYNSLEGSGHKKIIADFLGENAPQTIVEQIDIPINGIVHSAGVSKTIPLNFSNKKSLNELMQINFEVPFITTHLLYKKKLIANGGAILFISSLSGGSERGALGMSLYAASKSAWLGAMRSMALELITKKIRVNAVSPGMVKTNLMTNFQNITEEDFKKDEKENYPLGYGDPTDIAYAIIYFISDASKWVTGANLIMDGGATLR